MNGVFLDAFTNKWIKSSLPFSSVDLTGRTVIVTGSNIGLGYEAAKAFYGMNPERLILAVRSVNKGEEAKKTLIERSEGKKGTTKVEVWELNLSDFESVKTFAGKVNGLERLDVFLSSAGMSTQAWNVTKDGWEAALQTNVISTFMLAALIVPILKKTAKLRPPVPDVQLKPHLVIVASDVHVAAEFPERSAPHIFNALNNKDTYLPGDRYHVTKLLDILLTRELVNSNELKDGSIVICSVNPGFCRSELMRNAPNGMRSALYGAFARTTEEGAKTFLWACLTNDIPPGTYSSSCAVAKPSPFVESAEGATTQKRLWKELADIVTKVAPETEYIWKTRD